jgi:hypothetical protein
VDYVGGCSWASLGRRRRIIRAECSVDPSQDFPCQTINRAVDAQNAAVSALEVYCASLPVAPDPATLASVGTQACNENPSAKQVLVSALANLNQILASLQNAQRRQHRKCLVLAIIQLALAALQPLIPLLTNNTAYPKIASEIEAAIGITRPTLSKQIINEQELESLRTHKDLVTHAQPLHHHSAALAGLPLRLVAGWARMGRWGNSDELVPCKQI